MAAVAIPTLALGVTVVAMIRGVLLFCSFLGVTWVLVGGLAWVCVRAGRFSPRLGILLTTLPFGLAVLLTFSALADGNPGGFLLSLGQLLVAILIAWGGTRLAASGTAR